MFLPLAAPARCGRLSVSMGTLGDCCVPTRFEHPNGCREATKIHEVSAYANEHEVLLVPYSAILVVALSSRSAHITIQCNIGFAMCGYSLALYGRALSVARLARGRGQLQHGSVVVPPGAQCPGQHAPHGPQLTQQTAQPPQHRSGQQSW